MIQVDDKPMPWQEGMTVASLLAQVDDARFCSVVRLNGKLVSSPKFEQTEVPDNAEVRLLPLVAGG
ncbi:MAG: sulfur carrier protein ThiS [Desulfobacterales bacterium]|nr:sulfur carrier protein ThiS [Desulfobacterales bacterium]